MPCARSGGVSGRTALKNRGSDQSIRRTWSCTAAAVLRSGDTQPTALSGTIEGSAHYGRFARDNMLDLSPDTQRCALRALERAV